MRITRDEHGIVEHDQQTIRALHTLKRFRHAALGRCAVGPGNPMHNHLGIHGGRKDRAVVLQIAPEFDRVGQVSVVRQRDVAPTHPGENRLRVLDRRGAGGAVPSVTDRDGSTKRIHLFVAESFGNKSHRPAYARMPCVIDGDNARRFLTTMLQRVQPELRQRCCVPNSIDAENTTHGKTPDQSLVETCDVATFCSAGVSPSMASGIAS